MAVSNQDIDDLVLNNLYKVNLEESKLHAVNITNLLVVVFSSS